MTAFLIAYFAGIVAVLGQGHQLYRAQRYVARHHAPGRMSRRAGRAVRAARLASRRAYASFEALRGSALPDFAPIAEFALPAPGMPMRYEPKAGVARYERLRDANLESTVERELRLADLGLRTPRTQFGTPESVDEWLSEAA